MPGYPVSRHLVWSQHQARRHVRNADTMGTQVRALIVKELVVDAEYAPVGVVARIRCLLSRVVGAQQMLTPILDPADRASNRPQRRKCEIFRYNSPRMPNPPPTLPSKRSTLAGSNPSVRAI